MDPIASINFEKDTTLVLLLAAQKHGYEIFYMEQADLYLDNSEPYAKMGRLKVYDHPEKWFDLEKSSPTAPFTTGRDSNAQRSTL